MAAKTSLVSRFDDIVASTNILVAGTEGSEFCYSPLLYQLYSLLYGVIDCVLVKRSHTRSSAILYEKCAT